MTIETAEMEIDDIETEGMEIEDTEADVMPTDDTTTDAEDTEDRTYYGFSATYDPADNKLRFRSISRLSKELYNRVKEAGFRWAPKQELFVAPKWTPDREDLLLSLCGEIGDEDTTLVDRSEQRQERWNGYRKNRERDATSALRTVESLTNGIPLGQPILVGHHSEKRARRDAKKIQNGMEKAAEMWSRREYWVERAAGALDNARYKERPDVRHRRIKGLESSHRKILASYKSNATNLERWSKEDLTREEALAIANTSHMSKCFTLAEFPREPPKSQYEGMKSIWSAIDDDIITATQAAEIATRILRRSMAWSERWIEHYENRLAYEKAMLGESGGIVADKFDLQVGGLVYVRREWSQIVRINRKDGAIVSVSTNAQYCRVRKIEEIKDYRAPTAEAAVAVTEKAKIAPMCNYRRERSADLTKAQWEAIYKDHKSSRTYTANEETDRHRVRTACVFAIRSQGGVVPDDTATNKSQFSYSQSMIPVFITDMKETKPKAPKAVEVEPEPVEVPVVEETPARVMGLSMLGRHERAEAEEPREPYVQAQTPQPDHPQAEAFRDIQNRLRQGPVTMVVSAPQLFPTPAPLATRLIEMADIRPGQRVLEPSAGTGALLQAIKEACLFDHTTLVAVEIQYTVAEHLRGRMPEVEVRCQDFLECEVDDGVAFHSVNSITRFDRIVMNPPFERGADIKHIEHAAKFLKPGGRLVAICANGPRQQARFRDETGYEYHELPAGSFSSQGTEVNTAIVVIEG